MEAGSINLHFPTRKTIINTALLCVACAIGDMKATAATNASFTFDNGVGRGYTTPDTAAIGESGFRCVLPPSP